MSDPLSDFAAFEDLTEIGRGGFAVVYRAFQPRFGRTVAIKVLDPGADALSLERFERECEAMGMLSSHPNIVTIFDAGVTGAGAPYLVMEHMPGGTLDDRLDRDGAVDWGEVADIGVKLAGALETAHRATVLHRDVKPANVLVSPFGEPSLSDFGLARFGGSAKTTGVVTATLLHAPPEILAGEPATPRSDVYSLGSALFTLLIGDAPFWRPTDESILPLIGRISDEPVPDLRVQGIPEPLCSTLERAMSKQPADRPQSAGELGEALRAAQEAMGESPTIMRLAGEDSVKAARHAVAPTDPNLTIPRRRAPLTSPPPPIEARPRWRRRWLVPLVAVVLAAVVGGLVVLGGGDGGGGGDGTGGGGSTATTVPSRQATTAAAVDLVNAYREDRGLGTLDIDGPLATEARALAEASAAANNLLSGELQAVLDRHAGRYSALASVVINGNDLQDAFDNAIDTPMAQENLVDRTVDVMGVSTDLNDEGAVYLVVYLANRA